MSKVDITQKPNKIECEVKKDNYKSKFIYGRKDDGTLYWQIEEEIKEIKNE